MASEGHFFCGMPHVADKDITSIRECYLMGNRSDILDIGGSNSYNVEKIFTSIIYGYAQNPSKYNQ